MQEAKPESHHDAPSHTIVPLHSSGRVAQVPSPSTAHFTRCRHPLYASSVYLTRRHHRLFYVVTVDFLISRRCPLANGY
ncbi:hypothetical protein DY000_02047511 [Brassica cretica]|uniref:Uncharacterized protein n=1 Tax=Brassica cretica TaxID=69181 RepID=A0ABQ7EPR5_BRACR|nr:hypothetical protein DY000_02047511 [Brassica cretica]